MPPPEVPDEQEPAAHDAGTSRAVASVEQEDGQWVVHLSVLRPDGVVSRRIEAYPTRRQAELAATWMERGANRDLSDRGP